MANVDGQRFLVKDHKDFILSLKNYLVDFGYPTVTEDEVRKCLYEIFCEGKESTGDVVHQMILTHIDSNEIGKYKQYKVT